MDNITFKGLNHITLRVNNIEQAEMFYGEILGLQLEKKMGRSMTIYRIGPDSLVLVEAETEYKKTSKDFRVDHFGFFVDAPEQVDELAEYFRGKEVTILSGPSNRKSGRFVFISDPDGNMIEIFNEAK
ncbi:MAG: VOC family protein [Balneolales bacterium]